VDEEGQTGKNRVRGTNLVAITVPISVASGADKRCGNRPRHSSSSVDLLTRYFNTYTQDTIKKYRECVPQC
jgi:hypothetical protein